jgi:ribonuclease R
LAIVAKRASDSEQLATEAERENDKWKSCLLMKPKIGEKFTGIIQGFSSKAAFVRLDQPFVEVGVPLGALGGGFSVDEYRTRAIGMGGQIELPIGTKALLEITAVDEKLHRVSAWILEASAQGANGKPIKFEPSLVGPTSLREADFVEPRRDRGKPRERGAARPVRGKPVEGRQGRKSGNPKHDTTAGSAGHGAKSGPKRAKLPKGSVRARRGR